MAAYDLPSLRVEQDHRGGWRKWGAGAAKGRAGGVDGGRTGQAGSLGASLRGWTSSVSLLLQDQQCDITWELI